MPTDSILGPFRIATMPDGALLRRNDGGIVICGPGDAGSIAVVEYYGAAKRGEKYKAEPHSDPQQYAIASLFQASPDLLHAAEFALMHVIAGKAHELLYAAVSKAKGME